MLFFPRRLKSEAKRNFEKAREVCAVNDLHPREYIEFHPHPF